jgi:hypothetical protein
MQNSLRVYPLLEVRSNFLVASLTGQVSVKPFPSAHEYSHQEEKWSSLKIMSRCHSIICATWVSMRTRNHCCAQNVFRYGASAQTSTVKPVQIDVKSRMLIDVSLGRQGRYSEPIVSVEEAAHVA